MPKHPDFQDISLKGKTIYASLKEKYEPRHNGKFLAIEVDSGDVFLANDGAEAVEKAKKVHPYKIFYLLKIGFEAAETVARFFAVTRKL